MNRTTFRKIACLTLVLAMLVSAVAMMTVTASAATVVVKKTAPEIVVKGEVSVWDKTTQTKPTQVADDGAILITSAAEFAWFYFNTSADDTNTYRLTTSIDLASQNTANQTNFGGTLDGKGYTVQNMKLSRGWSGKSYMFGDMSGTIQNINFLGLSIGTYNSTVAMFKNVTSTGVIRNCHFNATAKGKNVTIITNGLQGVIENCVTSGSINSDASYSGGQIGVYCRNNTGTIRNCVNYVNCDTTLNTGVAFFVVINKNESGRKQGGTVENCVNYGSINCTATNATDKIFSAFVGEQLRTDGTTLRNNANYGDITVASGSGVAAFLGKIADGDGNSGAVHTTIENCVNYGDIGAPASDYVAGIAANFGGKELFTFHNNINMGNISGKTYVGGLVGKESHSTGGGTATNCANYGTITGVSYVGGLVGETTCGGGANTQLKFQNSANYGDVTSTEGVAGGIWGQCYQSDANSEFKIHGIVQTGKVTGATNAGALFGKYADGSTQDKAANMSFDSVWVKSDVKVSSKTGLVAVLAGGFTATNESCLSATFANCGFVVNCYDSTGALVDSPASIYNASGVATTVTVPTTTSSAFTDGTVLGVVNAYARENAKMPWMAGDTAPELLACALELDSANLELSGDLVMNLRLDAADLPAGFTYGNVKLATDDNVYEGNLIGNYYVFEVKDIPAAEMGTNRDYHIVVEVKTGETTASYKTVVGKSYSPVTYAQNICKRTDEDAAKVQALLQAMVKYAYYAEVMVDGTSSIIDDFNAATGLALTSDIGYTATVRDDVDASALNDYVLTAANLNAGVNLVFQVKDARVTALELTAGGRTETYQVEDGHIEITDVHAGMLKNKLNIKLLAGESEVVSATYAIGNYLDSVATSGAYSAAMKNAAMAAAMYMLAVGQYQTPAYYN